MRRSELLDGWSPTPVHVGLSGAAVERWTRAGEPDRFCKSAAPSWDRGLDAEAARLRWLATTPVAGRVATVLYHGLDEEGVEHLLTTAVPGVDGAELAERLVDAEGMAGDADRRDGAAPGGASSPAASERHRLAHRYGAALRELHDALDPAACPFDGRLEARLRAAARRVAEGTVDAGDFEPEHDGRTPQSILDELLATRPADEDLVVGHGDWCYPNVLFAEGGGWGMVDLAGLGTACRWNDLGIGARSTSHNLGDDAIPAFLEGYGIGADEERMRYYVLLDELQ